MDITTDEIMFWDQWARLLPLYEAFKNRLSQAYPDMKVKVSKSQISFYNRHMFAMVSPPVRPPERLAAMELRRRLTPAVVSYEGIQYQYMAPGVMEAAHLPKSVRFLTCTFGEWKDVKVIEKCSMCKMVRGQMVRWLAENNVTNRADIPAFDQLGYRFQPELSGESHDVFLKNST